MRENPDSLYADYKVSTSGQTEKREKSDLIFYTTLIPEWKSAIDDEYQQVVKTQKDYDEIFTIFQDEMHDKKHIFLTIHFYTTSIVLVQSREENLNLFEEAFAELKARVYRERDQAQMNNPNNPPPPAISLEVEKKELKKETRPKLLLKIPLMISLNCPLSKLQIRECLHVTIVLLLLSSLLLMYLPGGMFLSLSIMSVCIKVLLADAY